LIVREKIATVDLMLKREGHCGLIQRRWESELVIWSWGHAWEREREREREYVTCTHGKNAHTWWI